MQPRNFGQCRTLSAVLTAAMLVAACSDTSAPHALVATVTVTADARALNVGQTTKLTAVLRDSAGTPLHGRRIDWSRGDSSSFRLESDTGESIIADGISPSTLASITATSEGKSGSASVIISAVDAPQITGVSAIPLAPGDTALLTGTRFGATVADNAVLVAGVPATVTAASATQLTVVLGTAGYACAQTGDAPIIVTAAGVSGTSYAAFRSGTLVDLGPGQSALYLDSPGTPCLDFSAPSGATYLVGIVNSDVNDGDRPLSVILHGMGDSIGAQTAPAATPPARTQRIFPTINGYDAAAQRQAQALHLRLLQTDRSLVTRRGGPRRALEFGGLSPGSPHVSLDVTRPAAATVRPAIGSLVPLRIRDINVDQDCTHFIRVTARVVYSSQHGLVLEDTTAPLHGTMDSFYQRIGNEFETVIYPMLLQNFGDPLAWDDSLGQRGQVLMLFSPVLNEQFQGIAGFVSACDFYPAATSPAGNQASIFYAYVPTIPSDTVTWDPFIRGILAHESKHLAAYAEKFALGADSLEEPWLEEGMAQISAEIYQRTYSGARWKGNIGWDHFVGCEPPLTMINGCAGDRPQVMLNHFDFLYGYLDHDATETPIGRTIAGEYGGAWSLIRWAADHHAADESAFLRTITQSTHYFGVANLSRVAGQPIVPMLADWAIANALLTDSTAVAPADPLLSLPSWDQRAIFAGAHAQLTGFNKVYPLHVVGLGYQPFRLYVRSLAPGGVALYELRPPVNASEAFGLDDAATLAPIPASEGIRFAVLRVR